MDASVLEDEVASRAYLRGLFRRVVPTSDPEKGKYQLELILFIQTARKEYPSHASAILLGCETIGAEKRSGTYLQTSGKILLIF